MADLAGCVAVHVSLLELAVLLLAVLAGATVQGSIGFGVNLVAVPVVALVEPSALPTTLVALALPLTIVMVLREHRHIDRPGLGWGLLGRAPGTIVGVWIVVVVSTDMLAVIIGATVLLAVAASIMSPPIPVTPGTALTAGFASGLFGTATSIGGPPLALVYQHHDGPVLRSTLAAAFMVGIAFSLTGLGVGGQVEGWQLLLALALVPGLFVGLWLSGPLARFVDVSLLRPAVLAFSAVTGALAIVRGVW